MQHPVGHDQEAPALDVRQRRLDQPAIEGRRLPLHVADRRLPGDSGPEVAHLDHQRGPVARQLHQLEALAVHDPDDDAALARVILQQRRALGQERLDLGQLHRLHRHERGLLEVLFLDALEESLVVAVERLGLRPRAYRILSPLRLLGLRLGLGQPRPEQHFLADQRARLALGQCGLAAQEVQEGAGPALLRQRKGLLGLLGLERKVYRVLVHPLLVFEEPAAQVGIGQVRANLLDQAHRLACRGQRVVDPAEPL